MEEIEKRVASRKPKRKIIMKNPIKALLGINIGLCLTSLIFIIYQNFYFGLTKSNYLFIILINTILVMIHVIVFLKNKEVKSFLPLVISSIFYLLMYLAQWFGNISAQLTKECR